jgi:hypothetical protein
MKYDFKSNVEAGMAFVEYLLRIIVLAIGLILVWPFLLLCWIIGFIVNLFKSNV